MGLCLQDPFYFPFYTEDNNRGYIDPKGIGLIYIYIYIYLFIFMFIFYIYICIRPVVVALVQTVTVWGQYPRLRFQDFSMPRSPFIEARGR